MLACVCQPTDPNIFRHSPIPLSATPLKIPHKGAIPKVVPGRSIRITEPRVTSSDLEHVDRSDKNSTNSSTGKLELLEPNREALLTFGGETKVREKVKEPQQSSSEAGSSLSKSLPVKKKCAKKIHVKHKHRKSEKTVARNINCDKENLGITSDNVSCDKKLQQKEEFSRVRFR